MIVFYARVSTEQQNEARQIASANNVKAEKVFLDKRSGKNTNRPELEKMMEFVREGDTIVVSEISRLARSTKDLLSLIEQMQAKNVEFRSLKESFDTSTPQGRFVLTIFAALSELEREMILQRQAEGIEAAKRAGKYLGRQAIQVDEQRFRAACREWLDGKRTAKSIADMFAISRPTFYKLLQHFGIQRKDR